MGFEPVQQCITGTTTKTIYDNKEAFIKRGKLWLKPPYHYFQFWKAKATTSFFFSFEGAPTGNELNVT